MSYLPIKKRRKILNPKRIGFTFTLKVGTWRKLSLQEVEEEKEDTYDDSEKRS